VRNLQNLSSVKQFLDLCPYRGFARDETATDIEIFLYFYLGLGGERNLSEKLDSEFFTLDTPNIISQRFSAVVKKPSVIHVALFSIIKLFFRAGYLRQ
jgi:hypothetical protein